MHLIPTVNDHFFNHVLDLMTASNVWRKGDYPEKSGLLRQVIENAYRPTVFSAAGFIQAVQP